MKLVLIAASLLALSACVSEERVVLGGEHLAECETSSSGWFWNQKKTTVCQESE